MHFEVPKSKTLREFAGEYLMIVVSIATALVLEHAVQTVHRKHLAHEAAERMEQEMLENLREVNLAKEHNQRKSKEIVALRDMLQKDIGNGTPEKDSMQKFYEMTKGSLNVSLLQPTIHHEAWDVAVANQSASWMPADKLLRFSGAYAAARDLQQFHGGSLAFVNGPQVIKTLSDITIRDVSRRELFYMLNQMVFSYASANGAMSGFQQEVKRALPENGVAAAGAGH